MQNAQYLKISADLELVYVLSLEADNMGMRAWTILKWINIHAGDLT